MVTREAAQLRLKNKVVKWGGSIQNILTDYATGNVVVKIQKKGKLYSFSYSSKNVTDALSVLSWSILTLINCDIRGILPFEKTAKEYLQISSSMQPDATEADEKWFKVLGLSVQASNDEVMRAYKSFAKDFHPDTILNQGLKADFERRFAEISEAYMEIKKARRF